MKERLIDLETRLAFQEDLIQSLNQTVAQQQKQLDELQRIQNALIERMRLLAEALPQAPGEEPPPPHY